jgi:acyl-CoA synthetase (AMP-forming)/AMP-acid ligase II
VGPARVCPDDARTLTHDELAGVVARLARELHSVGVEKGDRVALVLPNGPEVVELLLAVAALGAAAAPLNPAYTESEYRFYLGDLSPRLLVVPSGGANAARAAAGEVDVAELSIVPGRDPEVVGGGAPDGNGASPAGAAGDVALLLHTSGTTSRPKQVPLLQRNLVSSARGIAAHYELTADDASYCAMPLFHVHGLVASALAQLAVGGAVVVPRRFTPRLFWQQARKHEVTWLSAGPTLHQMILEQAGEPSPVLRFVRSCSSALSPALMTRAEETYGVPMLEAYGMTEASHQMTSNPLPPGRRVPGSVGVPSGAEVRIVDREGRDVPRGETGEVAVRGPGVTPGYLNNPEANADAFFDGWFRTGDSGVLEEGYLHLRGRIKEMILRGGENISPAEIEEVLVAHPAVAEAVCFGIEDEKYGQVVGAAVTLAATADPQELRAHCRRSLAAFKVPETIRVVDTLPRTPTGKVQRRVVAAELAELGE